MVGTPVDNEPLAPLLTSNVKMVPSSRASILIAALFETAVGIQPGQSATKSRWTC